MWIKVDTDFLDELSQTLRKEAQTLEAEAQGMHDYTQRASATLEGRQYSLAVSETERVCNAAKETADNMNSLALYTSRLSEHIQEYLKCTYNRG